MFDLFVTHPACTYRVSAEASFSDLESALAAAFDRIADIVPDCSVWIEHGRDVLALMNDPDTIKPRIA